ncbi:amine-terminal domain cyclin (macronuclear) [Tetrahymena thermophila SB210]|uniref:Amine-terminal domain cyclin n=1 Tax=Tetrahymena thermophila (strain SB210) TaxID=312017 RepID=I7M6Y1_TETTS|nr:amine-terminal domain cyclin [Tetrahymena thermophila SB210]EAR87477.2 amine-terminal domain cyclin [Tetrahymena thermophila SB210]|eukprot:XP_001007722.2 amine-terminal domain cyclin [Tetrahymena thermophila SB210]
MSTDKVYSADSIASRDSVEGQCYKTSEYFPCPHIKTIKHKTRLNCFKCGLCLHDGAKAYKTQNMKYGTYFDPSKFFSSCLKQKLPQIVIDKESEYYKNRNQLLDLLYDTSHSLKLTVNTTHLAVMFMDFALSRIHSVSYKTMQIYAATCVMLAAKTIELDERIPFISKLKRYSNLVSYDSKEFYQVEQSILKELNWNLQCVTPIDVIEYYLSQGIVFSTDQFTEESSSNSSFNEENALKEKHNQNDTTPSALSNKNSNSVTNKAQGLKNDENKDFTSALNNLSIGEKENSGTTYVGSCSSTNNLKKKVQISDLNDSRIFQIVQKIEKDYSRLANLIIRDHRFNDFHIKVISAASVCFLRKINGITPAWNKQLTSLSNNLINESMFQDCLNILESKFSSQFQPVQTNTIAKRPAVLSINNSNMLLRDSESQNKAPTSSSIPTKFNYRNNLSTHTSNHKVPTGENTYKVITKPLQFSHTNNNNIYCDNDLPTQYSVLSNASTNTVLTNKSNYTNYQYNNSYLSSQNVHHHQIGYGGNSANNQNIYPSSSLLSTNNTYLKHGNAQQQHKSYILQTRSDSNFL